LQLIQVDKNKNLSIWESLKYFSSKIEKDILDSYKYIELDTKYQKNNEELIDSLKKLIYKWIIKKNKLNINFDKNISKKYFYQIAELIFNKNIIENINNLKLEELATFKDIKILEDLLKKEDLDFSKIEKKISLEKKIYILKDVYDTINSQHYNKEQIKKIDLIDWAIKGLADASQDKHTIYLAPTSNKDFVDSLNWEYEWIWAYVEMKKAWELMIISSLDWSPAFKAGLKWWDQILKIDWTQITKEISLDKAVSLIKWKKWTEITIEFKRWSEIIKKIFKRAKITINDIDYKLLDNETFYIKIKLFWTNIDKYFEKSLDELNKNTQVKTLIIDFRNNPGWLLDKVVEMMSFFIEKDKNTIIVKTHTSKEIYKSSWLNKVDFSKYKIILIQNSWTASASEIIIWTIKDYFPKSIIIWEKSYWKWSVQTIKFYEDWSSFKYTIAKWFTWLNEIWIDEIWIKPDIEIKEELNKDGTYKDNILEEALKLK